MGKESQVILTNFSQLIDAKTYEPIWHVKVLVNRWIAITVTRLYSQVLFGALVPRPCRPGNRDGIWVWDWAWCNKYLTKKSYHTHMHKLTHSNLPLSLGLRNAFRARNTTLPHNGRMGRRSWLHTQMRN